MTSELTPRIAVVGSGPSGCYLAQTLRRAWPESEITLIDRLASPYGLVRYGVAADHQGTKAITRQFERLFTDGNARFAGNLSLGVDVSLAELHASYDVVVLATGLAADRPLGIPGEGLPGVHAAGELTRTLNGHPFAPAELPRLGERPLIIGGGNVAIDLLRFLAKRPADYAGSDIAEGPLGAYAASPARRITIASRSGIAAAKSDPLMLRELGKLAHVRFHCADPLDLPEGADRAAVARVAAVAELIDSERPVSADAVDVDLRFGWAPAAIEGTDRVTGVRLTAADGRSETVPADAVIPAIGFHLGDGLAGALGSGHDLGHRVDTGRLAEGLYRTGWVKRGPVGRIPENRADAKAVAEEIVADLAAGRLRVDPAKPGFDGLPAAARAAALPFAAWQCLDRAEQAQAGPDRVRRKTPDHQEMLRLARTSSPA